jgi:hypothetical protein
MRTSIALAAVMTSLLLAGTTASAQVSSGSPEAAQQNFAKKPTDTPVQNNAVQNDERNATINRPKETPKSRR